MDRYKRRLSAGLVYIHTHYLEGRHHPGSNADDAGRRRRHFKSREPVKPTAEPRSHTPTSSSGYGLGRVLRYLQIRWYAPFALLHPQRPKR